MGVESFIIWIVVSAAIAGLGAGVICLYGENIGLMDFPGERSSHFKPTPRGGSVGICIVAFFAALMTEKVPLLALLILIIGGLGLVEDRFSIAPKKRLLIQFAIASVAFFAFSDMENVTIAFLLLGIFWVLLIVWTANLYNFMDGIDGMAAISAIVGFSFLAYSAFSIFNSSSLGMLCIAVSAANLGFLFFNFPKAKVFMGDVGSVTIGFIFSIIVLILSKSFLDFICLVSFLFTFYVDELVTMVIRVKNRENLLKAHRSHFYQILANEKAIAQWKVSVGYGLVQLVVGISVLFLRRFGAIIVIPALMAYFAGFVWVNWKVRQELGKNVLEVKKT